MIKSAKKIYLFLAFILGLFTLTSCIVVNDYKIHLNHSEYELRVGQTLELMPTVNKDGEPTDVQVVYHSYDSSIATYKDGIVVAKKAGEVLVKASLEGNPKVYAVCKIKVVGDVSQDVDFQYNKEMYVGTSQLLKYEFAIEKERKLTFTSLTPDVATIDENGVISALKTGVAKITTKVGSLYDENSFQEYTLIINVKYETFKINYELNGGTNNPSNPNEYAKEELPMALYNPTKLGSTFVGWYDNPEFSGECITSLDINTTGEISLYARWSVSDYIIDYVLNGGTNNPNNPDGYSLVDLPIVLQEPTKKGYTFIGWYQGNTRIREISEGTTGNLVLEAKWRVTEYNINYELNGGYNDESNPKSYDIENLPIRFKEPTRFGYEFSGWLLDNEKVDCLIEGSTGNVNLIATWKPIVYTINYDLQGGNSVDNANDYTIETETFTLLEPTRDGYKFLGWYSEDTKVETVKKGTTGDLSFIAKWEIVKYTIKFDTNGGSIVNDIEYTIESSLSLPYTFKDHYNFIGWFDGETQINEITFGTIGDMTLIAHWEAEVYSIKYDLVGGDEVQNPINYTIETPTFSLYATKKIGYEFLGWYQEDTEVKEITQGTTGNLELVAKWKAIEYTVTFDVTGGTSVNNLTYTVEDTVQLPTSSKDGYAFLGWYNGNTEVKEITEGTTGNVDLVAKWEAIKFVVTFDVQGGTSVNNLTYTVEDTVQLPTTSKTGYDFLGWYNGDTEVKEITQGTTGNVDLVAKYKLTEYTITYMLGENAENSTENPSIYTYTSETIVLKNPTREGYVFLGWFDNEECSGTALKEITIGSTGNKILYASWEIGVFNVTYELNEGKWPNATDVSEVDFDNAQTLQEFAINYYLAYEAKGYAACINNNVSFGKFWYYITLKETEVKGMYEIVQAVSGSGKVTEEYDLVISWHDYLKDSELKAKLSTILKNASTYVGQYVVLNNVPEGKSSNCDISVSIYKKGTFNVQIKPNVTTNIGSSLSLTVPTRDGFEFLGWYLNPDFSGEPITEVSEETTVYAKWKVGTYSVNYELNEGKWEDATDVSEINLDNAQTLQEFAINYYLAYETNGNAACINNNVSFGLYWYYITLKETEVKGMYEIVQAVSGSKKVTEEYDLVISWHDNLKDSVLKKQLTTILNNASTYVGQYVVLNNVPQGKSSNCDISVAIYKKGTFNTQKRPNDSAYIGSNLTLSNPLRDGFKFLGWYLSPDFSGNSVTEVSEETTVYAKWELVAPTHIINYELNGGTGTNLPTEFIEGTPLTLVNPTREFYEFMGWYTNPECNGTPITSIGTDVNNDITLYAKWILVCDVNFEYNGGNLNYATREELVADLINDLNLVTGKSYTSESYSNLGSWEGINGYMLFTSASHPEIRSKWLWLAEFFSENGGQSNKSAFNAILKYDNYTDFKNNNSNNVYMVTYELRGFVGAIKYTKNASYHTADYSDSTIANSFWPYLNASSLKVHEGYVLPTNLYKNGYTFKGWYNNAECIGNPITVINNDTTVYAKWVANKISINYVLNDGTLPENPPMEFDPEVGLENLPKPTKLGYKFIGWYIGEELIDKIPAGTEQEVSLTAQWEVVKYSIAYNLNGGSNSNDNPLEYSIESGTIVLSNPTRDDYIFVGWFIGETQIMEITSDMTGDVELTAKWELIFEDGTKVVIAALRKDIYWALSSTTLNSSTRLDAKSLSTGLVDELAKIASNDSTNVWVIHHDENGYYLQDLNGNYISYNSGNTANLSNNSYALRIVINDDDTYSISPVNNSGRQLELNSTTYNYFAFYAKTQIGKLVIKNYIEPTDEEKLAEAVENLTIDQNVTTLIQLPNTGIHNSIINWTSSNTTVIPSNMSGEVSVTQLSEETTVILTATISINGKIATKEFTVTVSGLPQYEHEGTLIDPYSVEDAINVAKQLNANGYSNSVVYVKGIVKTVTYNEQYKNYEIVIKDLNNPGLEFILYRAIASETLDTPLQNDVIVASGYIYYYNGTTPELSKNNDVNPTIENVVSGVSSISYEYNADAITINSIVNQANNRQDVILEIAINDGYSINYVKVNGVIIEIGSDGKYSFTVLGDTVVVIDTKSNTGDVKVEKTYTYDFVKNALTTAGGTTNLGDLSWDYTESTYIGFDSNATARGIQIGSSNKPTKKFSISTNGITGLIKSITVNACIASGGSTTFNVSVAGNMYFESSELTRNPTNYEAICNDYGDITISFSTLARAFYIKSITIIYEE